MKRCRRSSPSQYMCAVCEEVCTDCTTSLECPNCQAMLYCCPKHLKVHWQYGGHKEECDRMKIQMGRDQELQMSFFPWWDALDNTQSQQSNDAQDSNTNGSPSATSRLLALSSVCGKEKLSSKWCTEDGLTAALQYSTTALPPLPALQSILTHLPPLCDNVQEPQSNQQQHPINLSELNQRQHANISSNVDDSGGNSFLHDSEQTGNDVKSFDWHTCYDILGLELKSPAALQLHFAVTLAFVLHLTASLLQGKINCQQDIHNTDSCNLSQGSGDAVDDSKVWHVLYLGPEAELQLLTTFQATFDVLTILGSGRTDHQRRKSQLWIHFVGPSVPHDWHAHVAFMEQRADHKHVVIEGVQPTAGSTLASKQSHQQVSQMSTKHTHAAGVHFTFWHGCLHDVQSELVQWVGTHCSKFSRYQATEGSISQEHMNEPACPPGGIVHAISQHPTQSHSGNHETREHNHDTEGSSHEQQHGDDWGLLSDALVWAPNAGLVVYPTWLPTLQLLSTPGAPVFAFSDYCEEAVVKAKEMCSELAPDLKVIHEPQVNPARQPWKRSEHGNRLPAYSNGFLAAFATDQGM